MRIEEIINQVPKNELLVLRYAKLEQEVRFVITSNLTQTVYYLYEIKDDKLVKLRYKGKCKDDVEQRIKEID